MIATLGRTGGNLFTCLLGLVISILAIHSNYGKLVATRELIEQGKSIEQTVSVLFLAGVMTLTATLAVLVVNHFMRNN